MAIEVLIDGNGKFAGHRSNITSYSVSEESTPIEGSDSSGGTGQITFGAVEDPSSNGSILLLNDTLTLSDNSNGTTTGIINSVSTNNGLSSITADSRINQLNVTRQAAPVNDTLGNVFRYYLGLCGITTDILIDSTIGSKPVIARGFEDNVWNVIKQLCVAFQVEVSLVKTTIVLRPLRGRIAYVGKVTSYGWTVQNTDLAQAVEVKYYKNTQVTNGLIYPYGGWNPDVQVYQVDAGQTIEFDVETGVSLTSIQQPTVQDYVDRYYIGPNSVYSVAGNDGIGITAAQWNGQGGKLEATINPDTLSIHFKLTGASGTDYAPYSIAVTAGSSNYYSSLRMIGTGVAYTDNTVSITTGAPAAKTSTLIGTTVDNMFINSESDARNIGIITAGKYASASQQITLSATVINRAGDVGNTVYPTFLDFTNQYGGSTFSTWNTGQASRTFQQFNDYQLAFVNTTFNNQAFGNIAGARMVYRDAWYRIRSAQITENGIVTATGDRDTLFSDFNTSNTGKTFAQFSTRFSGYKFEDFAVIPLWQ